MSEPNEMATRLGEQEPRETLAAPVSRETVIAQGGMAATTELVTTDGIVQVTNLSPGDDVYALDPTTKRVKCKPITSVQTVEAETPLVAIETQRANLHVAPDQPIPYCTKGIDRIRFTRASDLPERAWYKFVNDWQRVDAPRLSKVDITALLGNYQICAATDVHGHTFRAALPDGCEPCYRSRCAGYCFESEMFEEHRQAIESIAEETWIRAGKKHRRFPYQFDADDFVRLLGWFVTEGSIYRKEDRQTAEIQIAQESDRHRESIRELFERLGIDVTVNDCCFKFGSYLFGELLESLCGQGSYEKRLPSFV